MKPLLLSGLLVLFCTTACRSKDGEPGSTGPSVPIGETVEGIATYYAATGGGNCSFDPSPDDLMVAAMNEEQYAGSAACGQCIRVTGEKGTITVRIVDRCPECEAGHLDLSEEAFEQIDDLRDGRVPITWTPVSCELTGNLRYRFKEGSSQWWTSIQVRNHRLPIRSVEWRHGTADWEPMERKNYNYFEESQGVGTGAFELKVTASDGQQLVDTIPGVTDSGSVEGAAQFD